MDKILLAALGLTLGALGIMTLPSLTKKKQEAPQDAPPAYSLRWYAEQARAEGKDEATVAGNFVNYLGADEKPEEVVSHATAVIARPVASVTKAAGDSNILTWYKFKVFERLSEGPPCTRRCIERTPPEELLPVNEDEFVIVRSVGTVLIDGVKLSMSRSPARFPLFSEDKTYLLFLMYETNGVASLLVGPEAVFTVGDDERLEPVNERPHRFKDFIKQRFDSSAGKLKQHLKDRES